MPSGSGKAGIRRLVSELAGRLRHRRLHAPKVASRPTARSPPQLSKAAASILHRRCGGLVAQGSDGALRLRRRGLRGPCGSAERSGVGRAASCGASGGQRLECGSGEQRLVWRRRESLWGRRLSLSCQCVGSLGYLCAMRGPRPGCGRLGRPRLRRSPRRWPAVLALESEDLAPCESEDVRSDVGMPIWMKEARAETVEKRERPTVAASTSKRRVWERSRKIDILFHGQRPNITTIVIAASH